ncbi:tRNA (adenine(37)-N6)-methyltransferase-like [Ostrea edulis]|uniref:tRNA (adenine(37)-N6)-methyltransferase-like n=1 Tax=Ostrea edulis TaxID=37623 RepID=UPI0024AED1BE|nr:tRNA (adenine(37)-N6)-methyltransferase-like [Ostrea edulis]
MCSVIFYRRQNLHLRWILLQPQLFRNIRFYFTKKLGEIKPIGFISSLFCHKRGTPRQPTICPHARGVLTLDRLIVNNPQYTLEGLEEFSHIWLIFVFHKNEKEFVRSKVSPPRLHGRKVGLYSTRSPHRPNPIGLSLAKLDYVEDSSLYLSGIDLLDGTPILDIKPYIPEYDTPQSLPDSSETEQVESRQSWSNSSSFHENACENEGDLNLENRRNRMLHRESCIENCLCEESENYSAKYVRVPAWIVQPSTPKLNVMFTHRATRQLNMFSKNAKDPNFLLKFLRSPAETLKTITSILSEDPRPIHIRNREEEEFYYFTVDNLHVTCWFYDGVAEVVRILPVSRGRHLK